MTSALTVQPQRRHNGLEIAVRTFGNGEIDYRACRCSQSPRNSDGTDLCRSKTSITTAAPIKATAAPRSVCTLGRARLW